MNIAVSKRAASAIKRINERWRASADHPHTFLQELTAAIEHLGSVSAPGSPSATLKRPALRRLLLERSRCHIYFEVDDDRENLTIIAVWDGRLRNPPKL